MSNSQNPVDVKVLAQKYRKANAELADLLGIKPMSGQFSNWTNNSYECIILMAKLKLTPIWGFYTDIVSFVVEDEVVCESFYDHENAANAFKYCLVRAAIKLLESEKAKDEQQSANPQSGA